MEDNYELTRLEREAVEERYQDFRSGDLEHFIAPSSQLNSVLSRVPQEKLKFVKEVRRLGINIENVLAETESKRSLLKHILKYTMLKCAKTSEYPTERMPLNQCPPSVIGHTVRNNYRSICKKLGLSY